MFCDTAKEENTFVLHSETKVLKKCILNLFSRQGCLQDYYRVQIESHVNRRHLYQCIVEIDR